MEFNSPHTDVGRLNLKKSEVQGKELLLIGTVHRDPDGVYKLRKLLADERPKAVAVEVSPYGLFYRRRNGRRLQHLLRRRLKRLANDLKVSWRDLGQIDAIKTQLRVPFEYRAAQKYCRDTGAALSCIDSSNWSRRWIPDQWQQLLSTENLEVLLEQPPENLAKEVEVEYKIATLLLSQPEHSFISAFALTWTADHNWQQREMELARELEGTYARVQKGKVAYVGGWQHLVGPNVGGTLYERLAHLQPRRLLLS